MSLLDYRRCLVQSKLIIVCLIACFFVMTHDSYIDSFTLKQQLDHPYFFIRLLYLTQCIEERCLTGLGLLIHVYFGLIGQQMLHKQVVIATDCVVETVLARGISEI